MAWEPSVGGFYGPAGLLLLVMSLYFLCAFVQLRRHPERKYELRVVSEEQVSSGPADRPAFAPGVSVLANEHSFKSQLRATAFTLFLFLATWALGALAVSLGHFLDMVFSCLYGAFCVTLGLFLLIQHCAKRDDVWLRWWACCSFKSQSQDGAGDRPGPDFHQPHCQLNSPCSSKQPLLSPHLLHRPHPQSPSPSHAGPCCVAVMSPVSPLAEPAPSPRPQSLPEELPRPVLPLQSHLVDRAKSRSFSRPRLQEYRSHLASSSMDDSVHGSHLDSPLPDIELCCPSPHLDQRQTSCHSLLLPPPLHTCQWHLYGSADRAALPSCCEKPDPFASAFQQNPDGTDRDRLCVALEPKGFPRNTLPRQHATINRRGTIGRNRSLQEDGLFGSDSTGNIRTGPWKNETTV